MSLAGEPVPVGSARLLAHDEATRAKAPLLGSQQDSKPVIWKFPVISAILAGLGTQSPFPARLSEGKSECVWSEDEICLSCKPRRLQEALPELLSHYLSPSPSAPQFPSSTLFKEPTEMVGFPF